MVSRVWSHWSNVLIIVQPQTVLRWHRQGFRLYWTWKSRKQSPGRPIIDQAVRDLIRNMSQANPLWGAPRIHGELLKLDIHVSQATVSKYMVRHRKPSSQSWKTFLKNHAPDLVSSYFLTVPTVTFRVLYVFLVLSINGGRFCISPLLNIPRRNGRPNRSLRPFPMTRLQSMSCGIGIASTGVHSGTGLMGGVLSRSAPLHDPRGRIRMSSDSLDPYAESASTI